MTFRYHSGEEVRAGDRIIYADSPGEVEFVVTEATGDSGMDWYLTQFPAGCFMIKTASMGRVLMGDPGEDLDFIARA